MKILLILLVGILGYVHCDRHACDDVAVNIKTSATDDGSSRKGRDKFNQIIDLGELLKHPKGEYVVARASHRSDLEYDYFDYCSTATYGTGCGPIRFIREFFISPDLPDDPSKNYYGNVNLKGKITMKLETLTFNLLTGKKVRFTHTAKLINRDDLIFQVDEDSITFTDAISGEDYADSEELSYIKGELSQPFAIHQLVKDEDTQAVSAIVSVTCNEKWAWTYYPKKVVKENLEGKYGKQIESTLFNLDVDHNSSVQADPSVPADQKENDFDYIRVKPVSTAFPKDVKYATFTPEGL